MYTLSMVRTVAGAYTVADDNDDVASLLVDFVGSRPRASARPPHGPNDRESVPLPFGADR